MRARVWAGLVVTSAVVLALPTVGLAAVDPDQDLVVGIKEGLNTAVHHASDLAQQDRAASAVTLHLQDTINCLEGPTGLHFRPAIGDPCRGQGHGIIPDLQAAVSRGVPGAENALKDATVAWSLAIKAMAMTDVNEAQPWALVAAKYLKRASDDLGR